MPESAAGDSAEPLKTTPLHAVHRATGAKMVAFAGWEMPLHYGSQIEEHHCVRRDAGMFDVSHMLAVDLRGPRVRDFLRQLLANDVGKLPGPGTALYSCMLNDSGGIKDDLIAYFMAEDWFRLVVNAATAAGDVAWIDAQRAERAPRLALEPRRDLAIVAVQGPQAITRVCAAAPQWRATAGGLPRFRAAAAGTALIARTGYTGEDGLEIMLPAAAAAELWHALGDAGVAPAGLGARDTLRLEAGLALYGSDMDETTSPYESGLAWTVDLAAQREFIGRAALLARSVSRRLIGLVLLDRGVLRGQMKARCAAGTGEVTSGGFAPTLGRSIGLARVPREVGAGDTIEIEVRGKWLKAKAVRPPFVREGRVLTEA